jgi:Holliday junction resolvase
MRRAARVDANQNEIVNALRRAGASVAVTSHVGGGFPDVVVGFRGVNYLFEIKDGSKPPSKRRLTDDEQRWHDGWNGEVVVVNDVDEALKMIGAI